MSLAKVILTGGTVAVFPPSTSSVTTAASAWPAACASLAAGFVCCPMFMNAQAQFAAMTRVYELAYQQARQVVLREARLLAWRRRYAEPHPN